MQIKNNIRSYISKVNKMKCYIDKLLDPYKRLLLLSLIDSLSKCRFPKLNGNKSRFVKFIDEYSNWIYKDHVSLTQLINILNTNKHIKSQKLILEIDDRIKKWKHGKILKPDEADFTFKYLSKKYGHLNTFTEKARYASLLWRMRSFAVHELRTPGKGWAISKYSSYPYYHGCINDKGKKSWELYIPSNVILNIIDDALIELEKYLLKNRCDPFNSFKFGSSWF